MTDPDIENLGIQNERPLVVDPAIWPGVNKAVGQDVIAFSSVDSCSSGWRIIATHGTMARLSGHNSTMDVSFTALDSANNPFKTAEQWWKLLKGNNPNQSGSSLAFIQSAGGEQQILSPAEAKAKFFASGGVFNTDNTAATNNVIDALSASWQTEVQRQKDIVAFDPEGHSGQGLNYDTVAGVIANRANDLATNVRTSHDPNVLKRTETLRALKKSWHYLVLGNQMSEAEKQRVLTAVRAEVMGELVAPVNRQQVNLQEQAQISADTRAECQNLEARIAQLTGSLGSLHPEVLRLQTLLNENKLYQLKKSHLANKATIAKLNSRLADINAQAAKSS